MKSIKTMLSGCAFLMIATWLAALSGSSGSYLGGISIVFGVIGIIILLIGFIKRT